MATISALDGRFTAGWTRVDCFGLAICFGCFGG
jgi:hypothetical protein